MIKQWESVDMPFTCHPFPSLRTFAFWSSEVRHLLLDLDPDDGTVPLGIFYPFLKRTSDVMPLVLLKCSGSLLFVWVDAACWKQADVTLILKGPPSSSVANC